MRIPLAAGILAVYLGTPSLYAETTVTPLISHDLQGLQGQEGAIVKVDYPPGESDPIHRHNASVFVYVLRGSITMQIRGSAPITLHEGKTFFEGPNDIHLVGRNASRTEPAQFLAFFVKSKAQPFVFPAH